MLYKADNTCFGIKMQCFEIQEVNDKMQIGLGISIHLMLEIPVKKMKLERHIQTLLLYTGCNSKSSVLEM